jgi:hypothetical protein
MNDQNQKPVPNASTPPARERLVPSKPGRTLNRRDFLKIAGVTVAVVAVGAGGITVVKTVIQDQMEALQSAFVRILTRQYGETKAQMLDQEFQQELETALSQLPFIGTSEENKWADNMPSAAFGLAAYRVLVPEYATMEEVGYMLYETLQLDMSGLTAFVMRTTYNEKAIIEKLKALAVRSQKCQYPEDWVMTFVEGDSQDFTYGVDVTECAIQKYLTAQGAPELTRYLCLTDYVASEAMGRGLVRDKTLAEGCSVCNFRYKQGRPSYLYPLRDGWPPKFVGS